MTKSEVMEQLLPIFCEVFDDDDIVLTEETTAADIDGWDSVEHFNLIAAVEEAFSVRFKMKEVSGMKNVGEMAEIIAQRAE
ncbi:MAG: acyl carrier protein [Ruminococcus sp.]|nr:acyl carrier protein [Ruminococcus sp.]